MNLPVLPSTRGISRTDIEWADYAVGSPFRFRDKGTGQIYPTACVKVSGGCKNCYAESIGQRFGTYLPFTKPNMDRLECVLDQGVIDSVLRFKPRPEKGQATYKNGRSRPAVFFGDTTDIFGEWVSFEQLDVLFACFALRPDVDFLLLTKRPERMAGYLLDEALRLGVGGQMCADTPERVSAYIAGMGEPYVSRAEGVSWPLPNVWLGCSVENQKTADERIPHLLKCPAAVRFVSYEPALGPVDLRRWIGARAGTGTPVYVGADGSASPSVEPSPIGWIIVGGESGLDARPFNVEWARSVVRQCADAGVPCFVKQLGTKPYVVTDATVRDWPGGTQTTRNGQTVSFHLRNRKGSDPSEWPAGLRVRQVPGGAA